MHPRAKQLIQTIGLQDHPEGGFYREVYRSPNKVYSSQVNAERNTGTEIYFLLCEGQVSRFHTVGHDEFWHFFEGDPLRLISGEEDDLREELLSPMHMHFQTCVKAKAWQAAETTGAYSLVGCTVAPGFDFADFRLLSRGESLRFNDKYVEYLKFL